jgi:hypothetical protein
MTEDLERGEVVARGELYELAGDGVAIAGAAGPLEGLHEPGVERQHQQVGVVQVTGQPFGFGRRLGGPAVPGSAVLQPDGGEQPGPERGRGSPAEPVERAPRRRDECFGPRGIVGPRPDGGDVVGRDHAGGEVGVTGSFRLRDRGGALLLGEYQVGAAGDRGGAGHGAHRAQPGVGPRRLRPGEQPQPVLVPW